MSRSSTGSSLSNISDTVDRVSTPDSASLTSGDSVSLTEHVAPSSDNGVSVAESGNQTPNESVSKKDNADSTPDKNMTLPDNVHETSEERESNIETGGQTSCESLIADSTSLTSCESSEKLNVRTPSSSNDNLPTTSSDTDVSTVDESESVTQRRRAESRSHSSPTLDDVQKLLTCLACNNTYEEPKLLVCLHSICNKCVQTYRENDADYVICSYCRTCQPMPPQGPAGLTPSYTHEDLLNIQTRSISQPEFCQACEKPITPEFYCTSCNVAICKPCQVAHSNLRVTRTHTVIPLSQANESPLCIYAGNREVLCKDHQEEIAYRCVPCGLFICHTNRNDYHEDHEVETITEVRRKMKRKAAELERKVKQSILSSKSAETLARCRREKLHEKFSAIEDRVDRALLDVESLLRHAATDLKNQLQEKKEEEERRIDDVIRDAEERLQSSHHLRRMLLSVTKESNDLDALTFVSYCEQKYQDSRNHGLGSKMLDSDILFVKSQTLSQLVVSPSVGELREIGSYPTFGVLKIIASFAAIGHISGMAMSNYREIVCTSFQDRRCVMYDKMGRSIRDLSNQVVRPWDVAFTEQGTFVVSDCGDTLGHGSVKMFSPAGTFLKLVVPNIKSPAGITLDSSGRLYLCDEHESNVRVMFLDGTIIGQLRTWNDEYLFHCPIFIDVNINNDVIVCDDHRSVKILSPVGQLREKYDVDSRNDLQKVFVDRYGQIIVVDSAMNGLHILTASGRLRRFVPLSDVNGLSNISCACTTSSGHVLVAGNSRVVILDLFS